MRISERIRKLEARKPDRAFLIVYPDTLTDDEITAWQRQHPNGTLIRVEYSSEEPHEWVIDDVAA